MQFNAIFLLLCATGVMAAPRILGCRMSNGSLNPSGNICTAAGGKVAGSVRIHSCFLNHRQRNTDQDDRANAAPVEQTVRLSRKLAS